MFSKKHNDAHLVWHLLLAESWLEEKEYLKSYPPTFTSFSKSLYLEGKLGSIKDEGDNRGKDTEVCLIPFFASRE